MAGWGPFQVGPEISNLQAHLPQLWTNYGGCWTPENGKKNKMKIIIYMNCKNEGFIMIIICSIQSKVRLKNGEEWQLLFGGGGGFIGDGLFVYL